MKNQLHILLEQQHNELIKCFKKHKELINGTFGTCKIDPVEFEWKESVDPWCLILYPVPKVHEEIFYKRQKYWS